MGSVKSLPCAIASYHCIPTYKHVHTHTHIHTYIPSYKLAVIEKTTAFLFRRCALIRVTSLNAALNTYTAHFNSLSLSRSIANSFCERECMSVCECVRVRSGGCVSLAKSKWPSSRETVAKRTASAMASRANTRCTESRHCCSTESREDVNFVPRCAGVRVCVYVCVCVGV